MVIQSYQDIRWQLYFDSHSFILASTPWTHRSNSTSASVLDAFGHDPLRCQESLGVVPCSQILPLHNFWQWKIQIDQVHIEALNCHSWYLYYLINLYIFVVFVMYHQLFIFEYCSIVHCMAWWRTAKGENLLFGNDGLWKLGDFGSASERTFDLEGADKKAVDSSLQSVFDILTSTLLVIWYLQILIDTK